MILPMADDPQGATPPDGAAGGPASPAPAATGKRRKAWTPLRILGLLVVLAVIGGIGFVVVKLVVDGRQTSDRQAQLQPFYTPPDQLPSAPGSVIRTEGMDNVTLTNGSAQRILYTSVNDAGEPIAVSGMVFTPNTPAADAPVVAWAHPTLGQADQCAPSRSSEPLKDMTGWLDEMLGRGWVVTGTDYAGLGTPGPKSYLLGMQSVRDIVNSVRAAKTVTAEAGVGTSADWVVWSHSQGGQAALWTAAKGNEEAPELTLRAVAAAAPAAELAEIMTAQWNTEVAWVIGPEAAQSFTVAYPDLDVMGALSDVARDAMSDLESKCILGQGLDAVALTTLRQDFFTADPIDDPAWSQIVSEQTPPQPAPGMPILLVQGTADEVVLAPTNALLQNSWCAAGVNMSALWLGEVNHQKAAIIGGPSAVQWLAARFAGEPAVPNCSFPPPVQPATPVD